MCFSGHKREYFKFIHSSKGLLVNRLHIKQVISTMRMKNIIGKGYIDSMYIN